MGCNGMQWEDFWGITPWLKLPCIRGLKQPTRTEILDNPKAAQLSLLQRNNPTDFEYKEATEQETKKNKIVNKSKRKRTSSVDLKSELDDGSESVQSFFSDDGEIVPVLKKRLSDFDSIMSEVKLMEENKIQRAEIILNKIFIYLFQKQFPLRIRVVSLILRTNLWELKCQLFCTICNNRHRKLT